MHNEYKTEDSEGNTTHVTIVGTVQIDHACNVQRFGESPLERFTLRVDAGTYPVEIVKYSRKYGRNGTYVRVVLSGVVTDAGWGNKTYEEKINKPGTHALTPYKYQLKDGKLAIGRTDTGVVYGWVRITNPEMLVTADGV